MIIFILGHIEMNGSHHVTGTSYGPSAVATVIFLAHRLSLGLSHRLSNLDLLTTSKLKIIFIASYLSAPIWNILGTSWSVIRGQKIQSHFYFWWRHTSTKIFSFMIIWDHGNGIIYTWLGLITWRHRLEISHDKQKFIKTSGIWWTKNPHAYVNVVERHLWSITWL